MCGIISYNGVDNAIPYLTRGIKALEYRGYDSFGCCIEDQGSMIVYKDVGRIDGVLKKYSIDQKNSNRAIFHTRWATHGGIEKKNSHPHTDCSGKIAVVHNGIIENWVHLKKGIDSHSFQSDTDTEIIPHMIEEYLKHNNDLIDAVKAVARKLVGMSSFVVMHADFPYMVAYKNGSPLVMGIGENGHFISSDVPSLIHFTNNFVFLHDGDLITFWNDRYEISNLFGKGYEYCIETVSMNPVNLEKGSHKHYMAKEIYEQPLIWKKFEEPDYENFKEASTLIMDSDKIYIIGSGSSYHAALFGSKLFLSKGILATAVNGEEIRDYSNVIDDKTVFIVISQSGETADLISSLSIFSNVRKIGIINVPSSSLARNVEILLNMKAGVEKAVPSTKSFTNSLIILNILADMVGVKESSIDNDLIIANNEIHNFLVPSVMNNIDYAAKTIYRMKSVFLAGRGNSYLFAMEGALKLKECTYIHSEALDLSGLKHGPLSLVDDNTWIISIVTKENMTESLMNIQELKSRGANIIGISPENSELFDIFIRVPNLKSYSFLPIIMVLQFLAYKVALLKNINPDMPRNLAKSVTVR